MWGISSVETFLAFDHMCIVHLQGAGHLVLCTVELSVVLLSKICRAERLVDNTQLC